MTVHMRPSQIEHWSLERLKPYARNAKTHDADQVARIAASMAEFGWTVPCLVSADGELIAGHGRVLAAAQLGLTDAPVIVLDHLTEAQRRAYELFCGSGSQLVAAERAGRRCCAVELDPAYCDVAVRRWEMATGRAASRIDAKEDGQKPVRRPRKSA